MVRSATRKTLLPQLWRSWFNCRRYKGVKTISVVLLLERKHHGVSRTALTAVWRIPYKDCLIFLHHKTAMKHHGLKSTPLLREGEKLNSFFQYNNTKLANPLEVIKYFTYMIQYYCRLKTGNICLAEYPDSWYWQFQSLVCETIDCLRDIAHA